MSKKVYVFSPLFQRDRSYDHLIYLMGKFTIVMQEGEYNLLQDDLKMHFKEITVEDPVSQGQGPSATELGTGQAAGDVSAA
jgi:hypothetical protein